MGNLASKLLVSAGKSSASEAGTRLAIRFIQQPTTPPQHALYNSDGTPRVNDRTYKILKQKLENEKSCDLFKEVI